MAIPTRHAETSDIQSNERTFFVTSATLGHRRLFQSERMARLLIDVLYHYRAERKYRLHEFVVMPDHFHVLLTVGSALTVERAVQFIKGGSAYQAGRQFGLRDVWQRGFSEARISSVAEYWTRREYILLNPVRARIVESSEQFPFSSARPEFELDSPPFGAAVAVASVPFSG